ncbi:MAG: hypothetical protein ACRDP8_26700 [Actinopolymorphaceae bacterium]
MNEIDRRAIRAAGDRFFEIGADFWRFAGRLDEEPYYLSAPDWGYSGGGKADVVAKYDGIRSGVRDFLRDGAVALGELHEVLYRAAARSAEDEEMSVEEFDRVGRSLDEGPPGMADRDER